MGRVDAGVAREAWRELVDVLRACDEPFTTGDAEYDELELAYGYRNLTHVLAYAVDMFMESDPDWPEFVQLDSSTKKLLGGNPDTRYHYTPVNGARRYRITGRRGDEAYLSFTSHRGDRSSGLFQFFDDNLNHHRLRTDADGCFEVIVSAEPEGENWLRISPDATCLLSRTYVFDWRRDRRASFTIEPLDPTPAPLRLRREDVAERIRSMTRFVRETAEIVRRVPLDNPNRMGEIIRFEPGDPSHNWATIDNVYGRGAFALGPSEALVLSGQVVPCDYWGVQLWNPFVASPDYRHHPVSINTASAHLGPNGEFRVAIAHEDPGAPGLDWISTAGERRGTFFVRWLVAQHPPPTPTCDLVSIADLRG